LRRLTAGVALAAALTMTFATNVVADPPAPPGYLEALQTAYSIIRNASGADATPAVLAMDRHTDLLRTVRSRREAHRDRAGSDDRACAIDHREAHTARVLEHPLPHAPFVSGLALHRMALSIPGLDDRLAVRIFECARAVSARKPRAQVVEDRCCDRGHVKKG
jgi:hypothetical protein